MSGPEPGAGGFEEYVAARRPALLRTAYLLTGSHPDAEDLVQTTLLRVVPRWARICADPDGYVRTVLVRESVTRWRRRRWRERSVGEVPELPATETPSDRETLRAALARLSPRQRAVLVLRYYEDLPDERIGEVLGCRPATVRSLLARAMPLLRASLTAASERSEP